jgi:hypothetical protein
MTVHAFTSCSYSYLNRARVLASSLRRQHPDWFIWLVMTDKEPKGFQLDLANEDYDRIYQHLSAAAVEPKREWNT